MDVLTMGTQRMKEVNVMGKGDRKSRKGKIWRGSNGKTRPKKAIASLFTSDIPALWSARV